ncbi:hypothetical protein AgCh_005519 [Apium graveolens]
MFIKAAFSRFTIRIVTYSICILDVAGLDCLLELLLSSDLKLQRVASVALHKLADKARSFSLVDTGPASSISKVYLKEKFVNKSTLSDVTFLIEGKRFFAHRICLLASSDAFQAMFDGGYGVISVASEDENGCDLELRLSTRLELNVSNLKSENQVLRQRHRASPTTLFGRMAQVS